MTTNMAAGQGSYHQCCLKRHDMHMAITVPYDTLIQDKWLMPYGKCILKVMNTPHMVTTPVCRATMDSPENSCKKSARGQMKIYSTLMHVRTAQELWEAIERLKRSHAQLTRYNGKELSLNKSHLHLSQLLKKDKLLRHQNKNVEDILQVKGMTNQTGTVWESSRANKGKPKRLLATPRLSQEKDVAVVGSTLKLHGKNQEVPMQDSRIDAEHWNRLEKHQSLWKIALQESSSRLKIDTVGTEKAGPMYFETNWDNMLKYKIESSTCKTRTWAIITSNVNAVCATCGKCVFNSEILMCVSKYCIDVTAELRSLIGTEFLIRTLIAFFKEEGIEPSNFYPRTLNRTAVCGKTKRISVVAARNDAFSSKTSFILLG
ncbi:hypothetical protein Tco_0524590 [Tanacetum coccineum]